MSKVAVDKVREERILMEVVVDAHDAEERGMGWYYYLGEKIQFPFAATCTTNRRTSPLKQGTQVEVIGMASGDDCTHEMFVEIVWDS
jgi:Calcium binding